METQLATAVAHVHQGDSKYIKAQMYMYMY